MTQLHRYLARLYDTIKSRREITVDHLEIFDRSDKPGQSSELYALLRFPDNSQLQIVEKLTLDNYIIIKSRYTYHYQAKDGTLIFRYDNAPHHQEIPTFPHHKHDGDRVIASQPPDLGDVLREIDNLLYTGR